MLSTSSTHGPIQQVRSLLLREARERCLWVPSMIETTTCGARGLGKQRFATVKPGGIIPHPDPALTSRS